MYVERKFTVFLSSTKEDLSISREKIIRYVVERQHIPLAMEFWGSGFTERTIRDNLDSSDLFVLIIGERYGEILPDHNVSYTEFEYDLAVRMDMKRISIVLSDDSFRKGAASPKAQKFREKVLKDTTISARYSNSDEIISALAKPFDDAISALNHDQNRGWVPAHYFDSIKDLDTLDPSESQNVLFMDILNRIRSHDFYVRRGSVFDHEKIQLAKHYWRICSTGIFFQSGIQNLFFEASSTIHFVTRHIIDYMNASESFRNLTPDREIRVYTNCLLNMLNFTLHCGKHTFVRSVNYLPKPPFHENHGATFGVLETLPPPSPTKYKGTNWQLTFEEALKIKHIAKQLERKLEGNKGIIHLSIYGFSPESILFSKGFYNSLLTTSFFMDNLSDTPKVFFIDESKFNVPFNADECFPVFGDEDRWVEIFRTHPICLVLSYRDRSEIEGVLRYVDEAGDFLEAKKESKQGGPHFNLIANTKFQKLCAFEL